MEQGTDCKGRKWAKRKLVPRMRDLTNQKSFKLTYLFPISMDGYKQTYWL